MCGRYYIDDETAQEIEKLVRKISDKMMKKGDVRPADQTMVIHKGTWSDIHGGTQNGDHNGIHNEVQNLSVSDMAWGFPGFEKQKLLINARSETVMEKAAFKSSFQERRCIIPATGYYEWDKSKNKVQFEREDRNIIYMAGIWKPFEEKERFVILTTAANESVSPVHDRMPLILEENEWEKWILEDSFCEYAAHKIPVELKSIRPYEQMRLF